tara:strand:+ start:105 stop:362 length:258 start_codon:yes stop_codon:yes gene_type:complete
MSARRHLGALALYFACSTAKAQIFSCKDDGVMPMSADGRQNPSGANAGYVEWWFFTFYSPSADVGAAITYHPSSNSTDAMMYVDE